MSEEIKTLLRADWIAALLDYSIEEIDRAIVDFTIERPDKCPNEGHIKKRIIANRGRDLLKQKPAPENDPERQPPTEAEKQRIKNLIEKSFPKMKSFK